MEYFMEVLNDRLIFDSDSWFFLDKISHFDVLSGNNIGSLLTGIVAADRKPAGKKISTAY